MKSITAKIVGIIIGTSLLSVAIVMAVANYMTRTQFNQYLIEGPLSGRWQMMGRAAGPGVRELMWRMMGSPEHAFLASVNRAAWLGGLFVAALAVLISIVFARKLTAPIQHLTQAARKIGAGDLSQRVNVETQDEIGELAKTFNYMASNLKKRKEHEDRLYAAIAHELRTPLTVVQGNLEAILDGVLEPTPERIASIHTETLLLSRLVTDLKDLSLAEAGQLALNKTAVKLREPLEKIIDLLQPIAKSKNIDLSLKVSARLPAVNADPDRVGQVLYNLLNNALRHTPEGGQVSVTAQRQKAAAREGIAKAVGGKETATTAGGKETQLGLAKTSKAAQPGDFIEIAVTDTGTGMAREELEHVFDYFYRVDESRSRATGGSGIGLPTVKHLVEAHGGRVWAESEPGKGSSFYFTLPVASA